jgi:transcriptional regulator with XRE-family HTH domain
MPKRKKLPATLSEQLRELIAAAGPSVYELARDAGVDRSVLSRFLAGKRTITLETADRLAAVLKLRLIAGRG